MKRTERPRPQPDKPHPFPEELTVLGFERYRAGHYGIKPPKRCQCGDVGWMLRDVGRDHDDFGKLIPCPRCNHEATR